MTAGNHHAIFWLQLLVFSGVLEHRLTLTGQRLHFRVESAIIVLGSEALAAPVQRWTILKPTHASIMVTLMMHSLYAYADLPLTVEDLITDKGKVKLDMSLVYANSDRQGVSTG